MQNWQLDHFCACLFFSLTDENDRVQSIYWRAEQTYRKYVKNIAISYLVCTHSSYVSALAYSVHAILTGNNDASKWPVVYDLSVPFDTKTIFGWYGLLLVSKAMDFAYLISCLLGTSQFIGCCIYIEAICEHFDLLMQTAHANNKQNMQEENPRTIEETANKIKALIRDAMEIHIKIYE